ncbi:MAG: hypothetical protein ACKOW9_00310 [Candidatus Paceibacterota bacterium]
MFRRVVTGGLALLGLLAVHELSYSLVGLGHKSSLLAETGHTWYSVLPLLVLLGLSSVLFGFLGRGPAGRVSLTSVLGLQVITYNALEVLERAAHGVSLIPSTSLLLTSTLLHIPVAFILLKVYNFTLTVFSLLLKFFWPIKASVLSQVSAFPSYVFSLNKTVLLLLAPRSPPKI